MTVLGMHALTLEQDLNAEYDGPDLSEVIGDIELLSCQLGLLQQTEAVLAQDLSMESANALKTVLDGIYDVHRVRIGQDVYIPEANPLSLESDDQKKEGVGARIIRVFMEIVKRIVQAGKAAADFIGRMISTTKGLDKRVSAATDKAKNLSGRGEISVGQTIASALMTRPDESVTDIIRNCTNAIAAYEEILISLDSMISVQIYLAQDGKIPDLNGAKNWMKKINDTVTRTQSLTLPGNQKIVTIDRGDYWTVLSKYYRITNLQFGVGFEGDRLSDGKLRYDAPKDISILHALYDRMESLRDNLEKNASSRKVVNRMVDQSKLEGTLKDESEERRNLIVSWMAMPTYRFYRALSQEVFRIMRGLAALAEAIVADAEKTSKK